MPSAPGLRDANFLTRTTLQVDESLPALSVAQLVRALQRVPGVLLAEVAPESARAIVAHDAAVPGASLLAAAEGAGVHAKIVADTRAPTLSAARISPLADAPTQRVLTLAAALFLGLVLGDALIPHLAGNRLLLPILLSCVWGFVIGRAVFKRKPKR